MLYILIRKSIFITQYRKLNLANNLCIPTLLGLSTHSKVYLFTIRCVYINSIVFTLAGLPDNN